ncbi:hypothetical protein D3C85_1556100 [compost metagenome]
MRYALRALRLKSSIFTSDEIRVLIFKKNPCLALNQTGINETEKKFIYLVLRNIYETKEGFQFLCSNYRYRISRLVSAMHRYLNQNQKVPI